MTKEVQKPTAAYILSLLAGIFIMLGGVIGTIWTAYGGWGWMGWGWMGSMMNWWTGGTSGFSGIAAMMGILGVAFGIVVTVSAIMLYRNPEQHELWGALIVVFSAISMIGGMGGMGIGLALGIIGGILAIVWKP